MKNLNKKNQYNKLDYKNIKSIKTLHLPVTVGTLAGRRRLLKVALAPVSSGNKGKIFVRTLIYIVIYCYILLYIVIYCYI